MTQRLSLQPPLLPSLRPHLFLSVSLHMGEQTLSPPSPASAAASDLTAAAVNELAVVASATATASAAVKIPFRPRKVRKISSQPSDRKKSQALALRPLPRPLTAAGEIDAALRHLRAADPHLAAVIATNHPPTFHPSHPPFHSLARSILYQQLAFKAAASIYTRFLALCGGETAVAPSAVLALTPHQLRQIGVSGRKAAYLHDLARKYHAGILSDESIVAMDDKSLFSMLTMVKGIGAWSVHMFMIFSLHRPDVLPVGDLGVRKGVQILYGLEEIPRPSQMEQLCERWRPYKSVGAWYMWRLVEAKGSGAVAGGFGGSQPQIIDPIQMLPHIG